MRRWAGFAAALAVIGLAPATARGAGERDPTFNEPAGLPGISTATTVLPGPGRSVLVGGGGTIARLRFNGSLDRSFGRNGRVRIAPVGSSSQPAKAPGGRIVVGLGDFARTTTEVVRFSAAGRPDGAFGNGGRFQRQGVNFARLAVRRDGSMVVAGLTGASVAPTLVLVGLTAQGNPDPRFGSAGTVEVPGTVSDVPDMAFDGTDLVLLVMASDSGGASTHLGRFRRDGTPDTGFGPTGLRRVAQGVPDSLLVLRNHRILVSQSSVSRTFGLLRFLPDGGPDRSFGRDGKIAYAVGPMVEQRDGKIVALDYSETSGERVLVRLRRDGRVDRGFEGEGEFDWSLIALLQAPDGRITAAGQLSEEDDRSDFLSISPVVARYLAGDASLRVLAGRRDGDSARVRVRCAAPRGAVCRSILRLSYRGPRGRRVNAGGRSLRVRAGRTRTVAIPLTRAARERLSGRRALALRAETTTRDRIRYIDVSRRALSLR